MVLSAKLLDQNIEDQLNELQIIDEENKASRCRIELYKFSLANAYALKNLILYRYLKMEIRLDQ